MATELFASNLAVTTVTSGGTDAPASGTSETWTVASSAMFGTPVAGVSQFHVTDPNAPTEMIAVTAVSGTTWTVTRGAESTTPVGHTGGFTVYQVVTTGFLAGLVQGSAIQGGTPGSPALTQQWQFLARNTTNANGSSVFGSVFWPGTFGSPAVTETSWDFGYNSPHLAGYQSGKPQAFFTILPDCGDTHGVEIECTFTAPDGTSCFPFQFVGDTSGANTGTWLLSLPKGDGTFILGVHNAGNGIDPYLSMTGLEAATAASPGSASFGTSPLPLTLTVTGALLLGQRLSMSGTTGVANSLGITIGGASAPSGVAAQIYLEAAAGANNILAFGVAGTDQWRLQTNNTDGFLRITDVVNGANRMTFEPGATAAAALATFNTAVEFFSNVGFYDTSPIAQPTAGDITAGYTPGSSTAVTIDGTFTGNTGSTAYTLADLVHALKKLGLIAA